MAAPKSEWDQKMQHLEGEIRRLEAEFNMFFAGRLPRPPWETKTRVAALVKKFDNGYIRNTADRFRFESLQSRYQKFIELCDRQLANRELGKPMLGVPRRTEPPKPAEEPKAEEAVSGAPQAPAAPQPPKAPAAPEAPRLAAAERAREAAERIVKFGRDAGDARVKELYEQLAAAKKAVGEAPVEFDRVAALVRAQVSKFANDGSKVEFKIATKDGKVSLTVKAEKSRED